MKNMTYDEFLEGINNPDKIKQIDFYIEGKYVIEFDGSQHF